MQPKDPLPPAEISAVIYKINCNEDDCNYVVETGRKLQTRLQEHKSATRKLDPNSQLATHVGETGHTFDLQRATILGRDNTKAEQLTLEAWFSDAQSISRHLDLPAAYKVLRHHNRRAQDQTTTPGLRRSYGDSPTASLLDEKEEEEPPDRPPDTGSVTSSPGGVVTHNARRQNARQPSPEGRDTEWDRIKGDADSKKKKKKERKKKKKKKRNYKNGDQKEGGSEGEERGKRREEKSEEWEYEEEEEEEEEEEKEKEEKEKMGNEKGRRAGRRGRRGVFHVVLRK
ncbi:hypothetical protein SprV_0702401000 [Sparganum proliferum]